MPKDIKPGIIVKQLRANDSLLQGMLDAPPSNAPNFPEPEFPLPTLSQNLWNSLIIYLTGMVFGGILVGLVMWHWKSFASCS